MFSLLAAPFIRILSFWGIFWRTTFIELRSNYAGSILGVSWLILSPILLMAIYTIVYSVIFKIRPADMSQEAYVIYVFAGLLPLINFSSSIVSGAMSLSLNRQILLNTVFPSELLPLRAAVIGMASMPIGLFVLLAATLVLLPPSKFLLFIPVIVILQLMFQAGLAWLLSLVTLVVRDIQHILQYITMILLVVTPIGYTPGMIPSRLKLLMYINPMYYYVSAYQNIIVYGQLPDTLTMCVCVGLALVSFCGGYWIFQRAKLAFYDYA